MKLIDISQPIYNNLSGAPKTPNTRITNFKTFVKHRANPAPERYRANLEIIKTTTHTGTHIDAPYHLMKNGKAIDGFPIDSFVGRCILVDLYYKKDNEAITENDLLKYDDIVKRGDIVILCTGWGKKKRNTKQWLHKSPWLSDEGAKWLVKKKIKGVGIDHFTICTTEPEKDRKVHLILLKAGIWIIEDLYLPKEILKKKEYMFYGVPLKILKASGSLVRPFLIDNKK